MKTGISRLMFDRRDRELLNIVNEVQYGGASPGYLRQVYYPHFHPLGIKELAESKGTWSYISTQLHFIDYI